jgi:hypothetical protein
MQVDIGDGDSKTHPYVNHFRALWTAAFLGWLRSDANPKSICFAVKLLSPTIHYG